MNSVTLRTPGGDVVRLSSGDSIIFEQRGGSGAQMKVTRRDKPLLFDHDTHMAESYDVNHESLGNHRDTVRIVARRWTGAISALTGLTLGRIKDEDEEQIYLVD